jgi:gliding motility-associated-like protein
MQGKVTGTWSVISGEGEFADAKDPHSGINGLASGENILQWTVDNDVCPPDSDRTSINVNRLKIPTLITPNGDPMNEYFKIMGVTSLGRTELTVFDRKGSLVYKNSDYDNRWNGVDYNEKPLPDDTYFFVIRSAKGIAYRGYIVIRR